MATPTPLSDSPSAANPPSAADPRQGSNPSPVAVPPGTEDPQVKPVSVSLQANTPLVESGQSVTLSWKSVSASSCTASGGWAGIRSTEGSEVTAALTESAEFWLSCTDVAGSGSMAGVNVRVRTPDDIRIELAAEPSRVRKGGVSTLVWTAHNASECIAEGAWSGARAVAGRYETGSLEADAKFTLRCENGNVRELVTVSVDVDTVMIEWAAPAENMDGTQAHDVAGYKVYWGEAADALNDSVTIEPATLTQWEPDLPSGGYYFAVTAFDNTGNESEFSDAVYFELP